jgi:hypothetical protein
MCIALCHYLLIQSPLDIVIKNGFLVLMIDTIVMIRGSLPLYLKTISYRGGGRGKGIELWHQKSIINTKKPFLITVSNGDWIRRNYGTRKNNRKNVHGNFRKCILVNKFLNL